MKKKTLAGLFWSFAERIGAQLVGFAVSIVLARLLMPEEYGILAIVLVFINLCNVFVDSGFGRALIQKKDADELDFSSAFYVGLAVSVVLYALLYAVAPWISQFYDMEILTPLLRVMGLRLIVAAYSSVQKAKVSREMQFRRFFFSTLGGTVVSAAVGITVAWLGYGVWALVAQDMTNAVINALILSLTIRWKPRLMFSLARTKELFRFGWKVLAGSLLDTLYEEFRSLYVGKLYTTDDLAYYTRGKQFPHLIVDNVNSSVNSVLFPAIASQQGDLAAMKNMTRRAMKTSSYILTPMLFGLMAVMEPLVSLVLTDKWLPCVPYAQLLCISCALTPLQTANLQAIYAMGRSDIALKLNVWKRLFGFSMVVIFGRISVIAMARAGVATAVVSLVLNMSPNKKLLNYGSFEQIRDVLPAWLMAGAMMLPVHLVGLLGLPLAASLALQVLTGVIAYVLMSVLFRVESFRYLLDTVKSVLARASAK
nr:lipopolysaccharide biosynthesis protein [Oscillospiraceae bacterium]